MKCSLGISNFLEVISSLSHSVVFLYFFALIAEEGFLISPSYSLELCIQMLISFLCFLLLFFSQLFVRPLWTAILAFLHFFSMGMVLIPVSCTMSRTFDHSSSGTLSIKSREWWLGGCRRAERSYSTFKVRRGCIEEIPLI